MLAESNDVRALPAVEEQIPEQQSSEPKFFIADPNSAPILTPKRQRVPNDTAQGNTNIPSDQQPSADDANATIRMILRSCTYFVYDGVSANEGHKEVARIGKAIVELLVDERYPPPRRSDMSIARKCTEYLVAPAASSLAWFIVRKLRTSTQTRLRGEGAKPSSFVWAKALWTVTHRIARQALIYRLFFRIGSVRYSLASLLGIVCCFFKDSLFPDFLRLRKWPSHFSPTQGLAAVFRSVIYAFSFSLPVQTLSKALQDSPRRRGNVKKLVFAVILSQLQGLREVHTFLSTNHSWTI